MKRAVRTFVASGLVALSLGALGVLPQACSASESTTGKRIALTMRVASSDAKGPFTNAAGWNVTLTKAYVATGAFYYFDGATIFSKNAPKPKSPGQRLEDVFGIKTAFAHPGHYEPGSARGQILTPTSVDLKAESAVGAGEGISGVVRSATFSFQAPAAGPFAAELGSHVVVLEGTAVKGADSRVFRAEVDAADVTNTKGATQIEGCPFAETDMQSDGVVTLTIKVELWFDQVDFTSVPASADGKPVLLAKDQLPRNQLVRGMKAGTGYTFAYAPR